MYIATDKSHFRIKRNFSLTLLYHTRVDTLIIVLSFSGNSSHKMD